MNWFTGIVLFVMIWWTALFAVLPIGTKPVVQADATSGWRGAPERPRILMKVIVTTIVACVSVDRQLSADPQRLRQFPARHVCRTGRLISLCFL